MIVNGQRIIRDAHCLREKPQTYMYLKNKQTQRQKHGYTCISLNLSQDNAVIGVIIMKRNFMYDIRNLEISQKY